MPSVDIACDDLVVADPGRVAARLAERALWRAWWPRLELTPYELRGLEGMRWTVSGELVGTAELWLEQIRDGVLVHWYLRAEPGRRLRPGALRRLRDRYVAGYHRRLWQLRDELERSRAPGEHRPGWSAAIVSAGTHAESEGAPMAEQTTSSITVTAGPAAVLDVIADFESYPQWAESVRETEVLSRDGAGRPQQVRFRVDAGAISDEYTLDYTWAPTEVRWRLVEAKMLRGMDGAYLLTDLGDGSTQVTYRLAVDISIPMIGMLKRKAEKVIIETALKGLKRRVES